MPGVKLDLHNHTSFSSDGGLTPSELLHEAKCRGLDCIAVTDHNTVAGALCALRISESDSSLPRVIPGIEVFTRDGEVIGLYLSEDVPKGMSLDESIDQIRRAGGVVYLPHPYDIFRRGAIRSECRDQAAAKSDIVEVVNGRALGPRASVKSRRLAARHGKPAGAGSDAHHGREVGRAYLVVEALPTRQSLVGLVSGGKIANKLGFWDYVFNWGGQASSPVLRSWRRLRRTLTGE